MSASCIQVTYECGDTIVLTPTFTAYPSTAYSITLYLSLNGTAATNAAGVGSGTNWTFTLPATTTSNLSAGTYNFAFYATKTADSTRSTAATGQLTFIPNLAASQGKTPTQILLDSLNATILALSASGNVSSSFNGQSFQKRDLHQLMEMRRELEAQVIRENNAAAALRGVIDDGTIRPNFGCGALVGGVGGPFYPFQG